jgi:hypothetical protein
VLGAEGTLPVGEANEQCRPSVAQRCEGHCILGRSKVYQLSLSEIQTVEDYLKLTDLLVDETPDKPTLESDRVH